MAMPTVSPSPSPTPTVTANGISTNLTTMLAVHTNLLQIALKENDKRLVVRVLYYLPMVRKNLEASLLRDILTQWDRNRHQDSSKSNKINKNDGGNGGSMTLIKELLEYLPSSPNLMESDSGTITDQGKGETFNWNRASELYIGFLIALFCLDQHQQQQDGNQSTMGKYLEKLFPLIIRAIEETNLRLLDPLLARCWYFYTRYLEISAKLVDQHPNLMKAFRQTALRHEHESHATLYNVLLRLLILANQFELAHKLLSQAPFPGVALRLSPSTTTITTPISSSSPSLPLSLAQINVSNNNNNTITATMGTVSGANQARFHYYVARLLAVQADYEGAKDHLLQALRKAPHGKVAAGFLQTVNKWLVIVQLLLGESTDRALFRQPMLTTALHPYLFLSQAVLQGDVTRFQNTLTSLMSTLNADGTWPLAQRLHQNVLKAGLLRLNHAYHRINLTQVQKKLNLASVEDAQFVLVKAIAEKTIHGRIVQITDHDGDYNCRDGAYFESTIMSRPYYTTQPQEEFNERVGLLNELQRQCCLALRYSATEKDKRQLVKDLGPAPTEADLIDEYLDAEDYM